MSKMPKRKQLEKIKKRKKSVPSALARRVYCLDSHFENIMIDLSNLRSKLRTEATGRAVLETRFENILVAQAKINRAQRRYHFWIYAGLLLITAAQIFLILR